MPSWTSEQLRDYERRKNNPDLGISHTQQRECKKALEGNSKGKTQGLRCPHVRFTLCRVKLLDVDAKYASVKDLLDGLTNAGLIHGDKEGQITLEVNQVKVGRYCGEHTIIEIETL